MNGRGYLGGANIAGILGVSPFPGQTPLGVYLTITDEMPRQEDPAKRRFYDRRKALEPWAAECFSIATGKKIVQRNERYTDSQYPWARAELDCETEDGEAVETKSVHNNIAWMWGDPDEGEEPPMYVLAQVLWGQGVRGHSVTYVHALIGFDDERIYRVERDDDLIADIRDQAARFWNHFVVPRRMPEVTSIDDVLRLYGRDSGRAVEASTEIRLTMRELSKCKQAITMREKEKLLLEYQIKAFMKDATTITNGGIAVATWKANVNGSRVFRIK